MNQTKLVKPISQIQQSGVKVEAFIYKIVSERTYLLEGFNFDDGFGVESHETVSDRLNDLLRRFRPRWLKKGERHEMMRIGFGFCVFLVRIPSSPTESWIGNSFNSYQKGRHFASFSFSSSPSFKQIVSNHAPFLIKM